MIFSQFQHSGAYKIVAYKKACSLLIHTDNHKNSFLVLGKGSNDDVNHSVGRVEKKSSTNFTKATRNYIICMSIKQRFANLRLMIEYLGMSFVKHVKGF